MDRTTPIADAIELLTQKAVRRVSREFAASRLNGDSGFRRVLIVGHAVRDAQDALEAVTSAAVPSAKLHASILKSLIAGGILRQEGPAIMEAA